MLVGLLREQLRRAPALVLLAAATVSGCGYTSRYVAPADGRARVIWKDDDVVVDVAGAPLSPQCRGEVEAQTRAARARPLPALGGYWAPRYYGPSIVVVDPSAAPLLLRPPLFSPSLSLARGVARAPFSLRGGGGGLGSLHGLGDGRALLLLAAAAVVAAALSGILVSLIPPESSSTSSTNTDFANAYNDLARTPGTACAYPFYPPAEAQ